MSSSFWRFAFGLECIYSTPYVEKLYPGGGGSLFTFIIPDGSTQNFIDRLATFNFTPSRFPFIEKSQWLEQQGENK